MKKIGLVALFAGALAFTSCGGGKSENDGHDHDHDHSHHDHSHDHDHNHEKDSVKTEDLTDSLKKDVDSLKVTTTDSTAE